MKIDLLTGKMHLLSPKKAGDFCRLPTLKKTALQFHTEPITEACYIKLTDQMPISINADVLSRMPLEKAVMVRHSGALAISGALAPEGFYEALAGNKVTIKRRALPWTYVFYDYVWWYDGLFTHVDGTPLEIHPEVGVGGLAVGSTYKVKKEVPIWIETIEEIETNEFPDGTVITLYQDLMTIKKPPYDDWGEPFTNNVFSFVDQYLYDEEGAKDAVEWGWSKEVTRGDAPDIETGYREFSIYKDADGEAMITVYEKPIKIH